jgi:DnaK suppressor protein
VLTPDDIDKYRQALIARQRDAEEQIAELAERCEPVAPDQALGRLTRNDAMQDQQVALHQRRRLNLQQTQIGTALDRVEKGTFGVCVLCKKPIDPRRLELVPESPLCVPCLEKRSATR